jgi:hypothetical protein
MPITLSKIKYGTRSIVHFGAHEQTLRLRLVSGPVDKKFVFSVGIACPIQYVTNSTTELVIFFEEGFRVARVHPGGSAVPEYHHTIF